MEERAPQWTYPMGVTASWSSLRGHVSLMLSRRVSPATGMPAELNPLADVTKFVHGHTFLRQDVVAQPRTASILIPRSSIAQRLPKFHGCSSLALKTARMVMREQGRGSCVGRNGCLMPLESTFTFCSALGTDMTRTYVNENGIVTGM